MGSCHQESRNPFKVGRHGVFRSPEIAHTSGVAFGESRHLAILLRPPAASVIDSCREQLKLTVDPLANRDITVD